MKIVVPRSGFQPERPDFQPGVLTTSTPGRSPTTMHHHIYITVWPNSNGQTRWQKKSKKNKKVKKKHLKIKIFKSKCIHFFPFSTQSASLERYVKTTYFGRGGKGEGQNVTSWILPQKLVSPPPLELKVLSQLKNIAYMIYIECTSCIWSLHMINTILVNYLLYFTTCTGP